MQTLQMHFRNVLYTIQLIFRICTGIGRSKDHKEEIAGLSLKHFVIGGIIFTLLLVGALVTLVKAIAS